MEDNYEEEEYVESDNESEAEDVVRAPTIKLRLKTQPEETEKPNLEKDIFESDEDEDIDDSVVDEDDEDNEEDEDEDDQEAEDIETALQNTVTEQVRPAFADLDDFSEDEDEEDEDDNYLQKFDQATQRKIIADYHPELQSHNYDEIDILSRIVRDENGEIIDPLHKTLPFITRYEKARILGERAKQLNSGAKAIIEVDPNIIDGYLIALKEYEKKAIPFIVKRPLPNGGCEYWKFEDLEHIE
jgi:DNA-directed RNA polymerase I, II, and III subunit RPABC2